MTYRSSGPSPLLVVLLAALLVLGCYYTWRGVLDFLEDRGDITAPATREAVASATAQAVTVQPLPTLYIPATFTPLPPCQWFRVRVERAVYRECPSTDNTQCPIREVVTYGTELCTYGRSPDNPEWYVIDLNPQGAFRDTVFMHESVLEAVNPTPTPSPTFTPLPTVTPLPSNTPGPTLSPVPTDTASPVEATATPEAAAGPSPTPWQITF
ncbi:MAG: hypothetical protein Kow00106_01180 [Anaerolineae bacterium]